MVVFIFNIALLIKDKRGVDVFVKKQTVGTLKLTLLLRFDAAQCFTTRILLPDSSRDFCSFQIAEFEGKETAQLVDRYKFLDLYPCSPAELR